MLAIYKRDLKSFLVTMIGCAFSAFLVCIVGIMFSYYCLSGGYPYYGEVLCSIAYILFLSIPLLTMRSFAEEQKTKTDQLLFTSRVSITHIVLGKFCAMVTVWLVPITLFSLSPLVLNKLGKTNYKSDYATIFAVFLIGCAYVSIGMFISSLTESPIISAAVTFAIFLGLQLMSGIVSFIPKTAGASLVGLIIFAIAIAGILYFMTHSSAISVIVGVVISAIIVIIYLAKQSLFVNLLPSFLENIPLTKSLDNFSMKIMDISGYIYYVTVAGVFIVLTVQSIKKRRYS